MSSAYAVAARRARQRRLEFRNQLTKSTFGLAKENEFLASREQSLKREVETLLRDSSLRNNSRRKEKAINISLKLQLCEYRMLTYRLRQSFGNLGGKDDQLKAMQSITENVLFLFMQLSTFLQKTRPALRNTVTWPSPSLDQKRTLYEGVLTAVLREYSVRHHVVVDDFKVDDVLNWFPEFNLFRLRTKVTEYQEMENDKLVLFDVEDIPIHPRFFAMMLQSIDFFSLFMTTSRAIKHHLKTNDQGPGRDNVGAADAYIPLNILPPSYNIVHELSINLKRSNLAVFEDLSFVSACKIDESFRTPSFVVQAPMPGLKSSLESEEEQGNFYVRGASIRAGLSPNSTFFSVAIKMKRLGESKFGEDLDNLGSKNFMKSDQHQPFKVLSSVEAFLKCSFFVCNYFHRWNIGQL